MDTNAYPPRSLTQNLLLLCGFSGVLFIAAFIVLGELALNYKPMEGTISSLEFTSVGFAQQVNFIVFGLLLIGFAFALRAELPSGRSARLIPLFQFVSGLAVFGDGLFIHDPFHLTCDLIAFISALIVLLLFAWRFWPQRRWRAWAYYTIATALLMVAFLTAFGLNKHPGQPGGLMEKLATVTRSLWSMLLTITLFRGARL